MDVSVKDMAMEIRWMEKNKWREGGGDVST
jgi:hypothetical protein